MSGLYTDSIEDPSFPPPVSAARYLIVVLSVLVVVPLLLLYVGCKREKRKMSRPVLRGLQLLVTGVGIATVALLITADRQVSSTIGEQADRVWIESTGLVSRAQALLSNSTEILDWTESELRRLTTERQALAATLNSDFGLLVGNLTLLDPLFAAEIAALQAGKVAFEAKLAALDASVQDVFFDHAPTWRAQFVDWGGTASDTQDTLQTTVRDALDDAQYYFERKEVRIPRVVLQYAAWAVAGLLLAWIFYTPGRSHWKTRSFLVLWLLILWLVATLYLVLSSLLDFACRAGVHHKEKSIAEEPVVAACVAETASLARAAGLSVLDDIQDPIVWPSPEPLALPPLVGAPSEVNATMASLAAGSQQMMFLALAMRPIADSAILYANTTLNEFACGRLPTEVEQLRKDVCGLVPLWVPVSVCLFVGVMAVGLLLALQHPDAVHGYDKVIDEASTKEEMKVNQTPRFLYQ